MEQGRIDVMSMPNVLMFSSTTHVNAILVLKAMAILAQVFLKISKWLIFVLHEF